MTRALQLEVAAAKGPVVGKDLIRKSLSLPSEKSLGLECRDSKGREMAAFYGLSRGYYVDFLSPKRRRGEPLP